MGISVSPWSQHSSDATRDVSGLNKSRRRYSAASACAFSASRLSNPVAERRQMGVVKKDTFESGDGCRMMLEGFTPPESRDVDVMWTLLFAALVAVGLGTSAMAEGTIPEEYQGVWAAARDCKANFQNVLSSVVNREFAACRVIQAIGSGHPESNTSTILLNCGGSQSRETWHSENIEGVDFLVLIHSGQGAEGEAASIDMYKRCPEIPLAEIPLSDIPGNPVAEMASGEKMAPPPPRGAQTVRRRPPPHSRAHHMRKHRPQ